MNFFEADAFATKAHTYGNRVLVIGKNIPQTLLESLVKRNLNVLQSNLYELNTFTHPEQRELLIWAHVVIYLGNTTVDCRTDEVFSLLTTKDMISHFPYEKLHNNKWVKTEHVRITNQQDIVESWKDFNTIWQTDLQDQLDRIGILYGGASGEKAICNMVTQELVQQVRGLIKQGYDRFVFDNLQETIQLGSILKVQLAADALVYSPFYKQYKLKHEQFIYCTAAAEIEDKWYKWCKDNDIENPISVMSGNIYDLPWPQQEYEVPDFDPDYMPSKLYLSYNNTPRWHRTKLVTELQRNNLLDDGYVSLHNIDKHHFEQAQLGEEYSDAIDILSQKLPLEIDNLNERNVHIAFPDNLDINHHRDSQFSLVTETIYQSDDQPLRDGGTDYVRGGIFFTEKTYKPFWFKQPLIVCAVPEFLVYMRKLGWQTFHPFIDETYDYEKDDDKRMQMIIDEIERLKSFTPDQWKEWRQNVKPIVEYNAERIRRKHPGYLPTSNFLKLFDK